MLINNSFSSDRVDFYAKQIFNLINNEKQLTKRPLIHIKNLLLNRSVFAITKKTKIVGFIIKEHIIDNYYELKSWYIIPSLRNSNQSEQIFKQAILNKNHHYLATTFQEEIVEKIKPFGFNIINWHNLPLIVMLKYLSTKSIRSIGHHFLVKKSYLLYKN